MEERSKDMLATGLLRLVGSQVFTRLATFGLNQIVTKALSVEAFGLLSIRFHLVNTSVLMLSREGFRRGCLLSQQEKGGVQQTRSTLALASLCLPLGAVVTLLGCWFFGPETGKDAIPGYQTAIYLQGMAAMLELLSEPVYILAQVRMRIGLRVSVEAAATSARIGATLLLLWWGVATEAVALSLAQVGYAAVVLVGYLWHFRPEVGSWFLPSPAGSPAGRASQGGQKPAARQPEAPSIEGQDFRLCCNFSAQAVEKLVLAEGTKIAMTKVQSAYDQGVYGLVVNLGSIAARMLLQPFEEAAFIEFSKPVAGGGGSAAQLARLVPLVKVAILFGLVVTAFGPANTYLLLHLLYGAKYSTTEAPTALAAYCPYILLLATNGILESFVQAVSRGPQLSYGHIALVGITAVQTAATLALVAGGGTLGMILADGIGMLLRISYCLWFIARFYGKAGGSPLELLRRIAPTPATLAALAAAAGLSAASLAGHFGRGLLSGVVAQVPLGFWGAAGRHIACQIALLVVCAAVVGRAERSLWGSLKPKQS